MMPVSDDNVCFLLIEKFHSLYPYTFELQEVEYFHDL